MQTVFIVTFRGKIVYLNTPQIVKAIIELEPQTVLKRTIK